MGNIQNLEANWPVLLGVVVGLFALMLVSAVLAWGMCKKVYTALLEGAEARTTLAEEKAMMADERAMLLRDRLENMKPDVFDAKIDDIITRIREVEYSRINGIINELNDAKIGSLALDETHGEGESPHDEISLSEDVKHKGLPDISDPGSVHEDIVESHVQKIEELEKEARAEESTDVTDVAKGLRDDVKDAVEKLDDVAEKIEDAVKDTA